MIIGYAFCGSFCTHARSLAMLDQMKDAGYDLLPIVSETAASTDTRFGTADDLLAHLRAVTGREPICTIRDAEPLGPAFPLDALIVAPCTGNTLAKLAHSIADTPVTMAAKSHLRNARPVIVAISTNDALAGAAENIGKLMARKHYYFVPFRQDDPQKKPTSIVADFSKIPQTLDAALAGRQIQPLLL